MVQLETVVECVIILNVLSFAKTNRSGEHLQTEEIIKRSAYVGCRINERDEMPGEQTYPDLNTCRWPLEMECLQCLETEPNPSFQTLDGEGKYLYSVHGDITKVSSTVF